jgi:hypothetical protein
LKKLGVLDHWRGVALPGTKQTKGVSMPLAQVGQEVTVDISGLEAGGISFAGVQTTGTIIGINPHQGLITVAMSIALGDSNVVVVTPDRVTALQ